MTDEFLTREHKPGVYECFDFTQEVWEKLTGQTLRVWNLRHAELLREPISPCLILMREAKHKLHIGVYLEGRVLHLQKYGAVWQPVYIATLGFQSYDFYLP
jgi:hypothetical protein